MLPGRKTVGLHPVGDAVSAVGSRCRTVGSIKLRIWVEGGGLLRRRL